MRDRDEFDKFDEDDGRYFDNGSAPNNRRNSAGNDPDQPTGRMWIPDDALENLVTEKQVHPEENEEAMARRFLRENVAMATLGVAHLAMHGGSERIRLDAQKYIIERVLGKVGDDAFGGEQSPIGSFIDDVTSMVAAAATDTKHD